MLSVTNKIHKNRKIYIVQYFIRTQNVLNNFSLFSLLIINVIKITEYWRGHTVSLVHLQTIHTFKLQNVFDCFGEEQMSI